MLIFIGELICFERLINIDKGFMVVILLKGKCVIVVSVEVEIIVGGFIFFGDKVDFIFICWFDEGVISEIILENICVLVIDIIIVGE